MSRTEPKPFSRHRFEITGAVQGVGFRPFVYRLAKELKLSGWARNARSGLEVEVEGIPESLERFAVRLETEIPPHAEIAHLRHSETTCVGDSGFRIESSSLEIGRPGNLEITPDLATCEDCLQEIFDPSNRRYLYPFTNCVHCGPRFSIILDTPYDRERTTMSDFEMCPLCREEFGSPADRRFHAQPNACPECGPQLSWVNSSGRVLDSKEAGLESACRAIEDGQIVAVKGIGGFHLLVDARNEQAIRRLRERKKREAKPLAVMFSSLEEAEHSVNISSTEAELLTSPMAPIVLLNRLPECSLPSILAPDNPTLGVLLPYSPIHHILLRRLRFPVVATSGNLGDEPVCTDNDEAITRLNDVADGFLMHNRTIQRPVDDSVARVAAGRELVLRRSRGYVPKSITVTDAKFAVLAAGGDLKNTIAVAEGERVWLSQHIGDLGCLESKAAFQMNLDSFPKLLGIQPGVVVLDQHPGYHSRIGAESHQLPRIELQHHFCHAAACLAENGIDPEEKALAVVWDGSGFGEDQTIWGGEFLLCQNNQFERYAWLKPFLLPGNEKAVRDPRFAAMGCLHEAGIPLEKSRLLNDLTNEERLIGEKMLRQGINTTRCSSAGRLFDAVSALCGIRKTNEFEGQAAMALEFSARQKTTNWSYPIDFSKSGWINWGPILRHIIQDLNSGTAEAEMAPARFHCTLAQMITDVAKDCDCRFVALSGGCFQNTLLLETVIERLRNIGKIPVWHRLIPPNDGGIAFGQAVIASRMNRTHSETN